MLAYRANQLKRKFAYVGRPDGLGNRIEEIIRLEAICYQNATTCEYVWKNTQANRSYKPLLAGDAVKIVDAPTSGTRTVDMKDFPDTVDHETIFRMGRKIRPLFDIRFDQSVKPVGIHIRATDRVGVDHPHFMKDEGELKLFLSSAIEWANARRPKSIFICSDSARCRDAFLERLEPGISVVEPTFSEGTPQDYADFFALANCKEIAMASRFSSFAITASLIANSPLHTFDQSREAELRYKGEFKYHPLARFHNIDEPLIEPKRNHSVRAWFSRLLAR